MLKLAVVGAQTLLGRELIGVLESRDCSVLPLATGPLSSEEEEGDLVVFAPTPELMEGLDLVILTDTPQEADLQKAFPGRVLDLRENAPNALDPMPLAGSWKEGVKAYRGRPALDQVIALLPLLVEGFSEVSGTHMRSVAYLGDLGLDGLMEQTVELLQGNEPDTTKLGYRAAFEALPQVPRGSLTEVKIPVFHGDLLVLHLHGAQIRHKDAPEGVKWVLTPPSSRDVAVSPELLAYMSCDEEARRATLILGFDAILWGVLRPVLRLLSL